MPIDWFDSKYLRPLMAGKNIVRVGKEPAQYTTVAAALSAITDSSSSNPYLIIVGPGEYTQTADLVDTEDRQYVGTRRICHARRDGGHIEPVSQSAQGTRAHRV